MVNVHARYIDVLETEGWLDRGHCDLPTDKQIAERQAAGMVCRPPSWPCHRLHQERQRGGDGAHRPAQMAELLEVQTSRVLPVRAPSAATPTPSGATRAPEIISTAVVNQMVNLSGISFDHRMTEDTGGSSVVDVTRAWIVAREVFELHRRCGPRSRP